MLESSEERVLSRVRPGPMQAAGAPFLAVAGFARKKPLGAIGGAIVLALVVVALLAPLIAPYGAREIIRDENNKVPVYASPEAAYPLGTDHVGRDVMSRVMHGARISLYVGFMTVALGVTAFFILGVVSTYIGGPFDMVVQRVVDAKMSMPGLVIALAIMAALGSSLNNVVLAIIIGLSPAVVRTVRSQVLSLKEMDYVLAARALGASSTRIIFRHIAPNCFAIFLILATYYLGFAIILEASLSFLGVGSPPDIPSWGSMLTTASQEHVKTAPWTGIFPGLAIFIVVLGFNLMGDALRDVFDPRLRGSR